jgi:hypothetical protein
LRGRAVAAYRTRGGWRPVADFIALLPAAPHRNIELKARDPFPAEVFAACVAFDAQDRGDAPVVDPLAARLARR